MFEIGLENRDFCKSLHFYIVDAGKKKKNELHLLACSAALVVKLAKISPKMAQKNPPPVISHHNLKTPLPPKPISSFVNDP